MKSNILLICLAASGVMFFGTPGISHAQNRASCSRIRANQQNLQKAVDRYGPYSSQAQHERSELQRDSANCGYYDGGNNGGYNNGGYNGGYDGRGAYNTPAFDNGYRDGVSDGQRDRQQRKAYRPDKNDRYEDADHGYNKAYGDKNFYKSQYRQAYQRGYADGYRL